MEKPFPGRDDLYAGTEFRLVVPRHDRAVVHVQVPPSQLKCRRLPRNRRAVLHRPRHLHETSLLGHHVNDMEIDLCPVWIGSVLRGQTLPEGTDPSRP